MNRLSYKMNKQPSSPYYTKRPVIIRTYSPKVIHTEAHNFMQLVQKLTGFTNHKKKKNNKKKKELRASKDQQFSEISATNAEASNQSTTKSSFCGGGVAEITSVETLAHNTNSNNPSYYNRSNGVKVSDHSVIRNEQPITQNSCEDISSANAACSYSYSTVMTQTPYIVCNAPDLQDWFHTAPHYNSSSQSLHLPCKHTPDADSENIYVKPSCEESFGFLQNLGSPSSTAIGTSIYNVAAILPFHVLEKEFEYQYLL